MIISIATGPWLPVPAIQGGAIPRMWQGLAEEFAARGHQVNIICRAFPGHPSTEVIQGVRYTRWSGFSQSPNIKLDLIKDLLYAIQTVPTLPHSDILVINDFWLPVFAALRPKVGKIVINANRFPKGQYWLYAKTDFFAAASSAIQAAIMQQYPAATSRIRVFPNPIDTHTFRPPVIPCSQREQKTILYVGRIHPEKGIHLLLDAFLLISQQAPQIKLRIVGPARESQGGGGKAYLRTLKMKAQGLPVEFSPPIFDTSQLVNIYQDADLFCYPSLAEKGEAFGVAPLEAMACGLVPVVSKLSCFRDFITDGQTGYFFDHRSAEPCKQLANTLLKAIFTWEATSKMAKNAVQQARNFSYQAVAKQYLSEFEALLKKASEVLV